MADIKQTTDRPNTTHVETANVLEKVAVHGLSADDETARYAEGAPILIDEATNKRLFWKINKRILFVMLVTYFCQSLDKGTLGFSSIMGIKQDAHLVGQQVRNHNSSCKPELTPDSIVGWARFCTWESWLVNIHKIFCYRSFRWPSFWQSSKHIEKC